MSREMLVDFPQNKGLHSRCIDSLLRYCGYNQHQSVVDQAEDHQFHKRKKISLKNKHIKASKKPQNKLVGPTTPQTGAKSEAKPQKSDSRQLNLPLQQIDQSKEVKMHPTSKLFIQVHLEVPHYDFPFVFSTQNPVKGRQKAQATLDYEQQFKKILFEESQEVESETYYEKPPVSPTGKQLESLCIHRSKSIYDQEDSSSKSSVVIPFGYSQKMTASTFIHTKTSQSIILPQTKRRASSRMSEESISDDSFGVFSFVNPFQLGERIPIS